MTRQLYVDQLVQAALDYADRGWHVFPLVPGTKRPARPAHPAARCDRSDPFCRHGHTSWEQRATRDPGRIRRAWSTRPFGIGIACGPSNLLVIDTDLAKHGEPAPAPWADTRFRAGDAVLANVAAGRPLPATFTVATAGGGFHRYYRAPAGVRLGNSAGKLGWLIDTRGAGGYVVAPPTRLLQNRYNQLDGYPNPAALPDWITQLLTGTATSSQPATSAPQTPARRPPAPEPAIRSTRYATAALAGETAHVRDARPGQRNHSLFCAAVALGQLVADHQLDDNTVRDLLLAACADHIGVDGFTTGEAQATITSGLARGTADPRSRRTGRNVA